jgi:hypothetical protein
MVCYALQKVHFCRKLLSSQELLCFSASVEVKLPKLSPVRIRSPAIDGTPDPNVSYTYLPTVGSAALKVKAGVVLPPRPKGARCVRSSQITQVSTSQRHRTGLGSDPRPRAAPPVWSGAIFCLTSSHSAVKLADGSFEFRHAFTTLSCWTKKGRSTCAPLGCTEPC